MAKKKENYVVRILTTRFNQTKIKFVTDVDTKSKYAKWENGKDAMIFSKEYATDLVFGLCVNGYVAVPILKADYLDLCNCEIEKDKELSFEDMIKNTIGCLEYWMKRTGEYVMELNENTLSEDECVMEDTKEALEFLYELVE